MQKDRVARTIEDSFRRQVQKDRNVKNAYLLVHSAKVGIHMNIAEGSTGSTTACPQQPNYMASVGKIFTSTLIGMLHEEQKLSFDDRIAGLIDEELLNGLHIFKGTDYSHQIQIKHLLNHTSGLNDFFFPLLDKLIGEPEFRVTPRKAIEWLKSNTRPHCPPGAGFKYADANYHLLGLIIEHVTGKPFHAVLHERLFEPLAMKHSWMLGYSVPAQEPGYPVAEFSIHGTKLNDATEYAHLDYAGGGIVATSEDLLVFLKALVELQLVNEATLRRMREDRSRFAFGIDYGYGIWLIKTVPVLMPAKFNSWGAAGITGAFLFYHPGTAAYLIGTFNDSSYQRKALRFMMSKLINELAKLT